MKKRRLSSLRRAVCLAVVLSALGAGTAVAAPSARPTEVGSTAVGGSPEAVAVSPDGKQAFVMIDDSDKDGPTALVKVVDTGTGAIKATLPLPRSNALMAGQVTVGRDGKRAYALAGQTVTVIDAVADTVLRTFAVPDQPRPAGWAPGLLKSVAVSPDGASLYVSQDGARTYRQGGPSRVMVFAAATGAFTGSVDINNQYVNDVLVHPGGKDVYVSGGAGLVHLDVAATPPTVVRTVAQPPGESGTSGATISADGSRIYDVVNNLGYVRVISTAGDGTLATIAVVQGYADLRNPMLSHDGTKLYVVNDDINGPSVAVADTATRTLLDPFADVEATDVRGAAISADDSTLYLAGSGTLQFLTVR
ncbi:YncE family protein [Streptomyces olivoreticuli]